MIKNLMFAAVLMLAGCVATGSHIITGTVRPAISPEAVKIYADAPANFEKIGFITAVCADGNLQRGSDKRVSELKRQAGLLGANGVLLGADTKNPPVPIGTPYGVVNADNGSTLNGIAIFVP